MLVLQLGCDSFQYIKSVWAGWDNGVYLKVVVDDFQTCKL